MQKTSRALKRNTKEDFTHILQAIKPYTDYIYSHLRKYLDMSATEGLKVTLTTNGILIHKVHNELIGAKVLRQIYASFFSSKRYVPVLPF